MAQVSLYIDDNTMQRARREAAARGVSVSKFVSGLMRSHIGSEWSEAFRSTFGAISDDLFVKHPAIGFEKDAERETL